MANMLTDSEKLKDEDAVVQLESIGESHESLLKVERRTIRLIDWRMLPLLGLLYSVALIDRTNLAVARTAGMEVDLRLGIGERYSIVSMIYFIPYTLLQFPGNLVLRLVGARNLITTCVTCWGIAQLAMAFVQTWGELAACRVLLGTFEAGFFPSLVFIITTWYTRYEVQKRLAIFWISGQTINSFGTILAYVITLLKGKAGLNGWRWIFLLEGILTIALGVITWLFIPDFPDKARFLTEDQRKLILDRVEADRGDSVPDELGFRKIIKHLSEPSLWAFALMFIAATAPAYAYVFFSTIIIKAMGYTEAAALLMTAPPGILAGITCYISSSLADRSKHRAVWLCLNNVICLVGLIVTAYANANAARYVGLFLIQIGAVGAIPCVLAFSANNIRGQTKRAAHSAVVIAAGGVGGIFASTVFRQKDYPRYVNGLWATVGLQILSIMLVGATAAEFNRRNRARREGKLGLLEGHQDFYYTI